MTPKAGDWVEAVTRHADPKTGAGRTVSLGKVLDVVHGGSKILAYVILVGGRRLPVKPADVVSILTEKSS